MLEHFFSINTIMFTFWDYQMSYLEFFGTIFNLWCVYLAARNKAANWPIGIVGIILYLFLFYQIQLYSDLFEQVYFLLMSFYGWYVWSMIDKDSKTKPQSKVGTNSPKANLVWLAVIIIGTGLLTVFTANINKLWPQYFPLPASYPFLDAFTTVMSFAATIIMARRKIECWYLWILVDIIGIWLYFAKGVKFISLEYVIFLLLAAKGLLDWRRQANQMRKSEIAQA